MPDGATLLADRYVPAGSGEAPLILVRCPYGRRGVFGVMAGRLFAERGFQSLVQSCRGTFGSAGELDPFGDIEQSDGLATVEWLRRQPWYPGSFGTWGPSYLGMTQWALAALALPDHKAMAVQVSTARPREMVRFGGSFALETMLEWIDQVAHQERPGAMLRQQLRMRALRKLDGHVPLGDLDRLATGTRKPYWQAWLADDDEFWARHSFAAGPERVTASVDMVAGWYDIFLPAQLRDYAALRAAGHEPRLTIGPWRHTDNDAGAHWVQHGLEFLGAHLDGSAAEPRSDPVRIFVTGTEDWRDLPVWPPSTGQAWYLHRTAIVRGELPAQSAPAAYTYDPADPTPNLAGPVGAQGPARVDNRMLEARPDVLTFTGPALVADLEMIGVRPSNCTWRPTASTPTFSPASAKSTRRAVRSMSATACSAFPPARHPTKPMAAAALHSSSIRSRIGSRPATGSGSRSLAAPTRGTRATPGPMSRWRLRRRYCLRTSGSTTIQTTRQRSSCR